MRYNKETIGSTLVILLFAFLAIGSADTTENNSQSTASEKQEETQKVYNINQDVRVGDVRWKVTKVVDRGGELKASESKYKSIANTKKTPGKFVQISVEVENLGTEMKSASNLKLVDNQGREFISSSDTSEWVPEDEEMFLLDNLNPNIPITFTDIYEIPEDSEGLKLMVGDLEFFGGDEAKIELGI